MKGKNGSDDTAKREGWFLTNFLAYLVQNGGLANQLGLPVGSVVRCFERKWRELTGAEMIPHEEQKDLPIATHGQPDVLRMIVAEGSSNKRNNSTVFISYMFDFSCFSTSVRVMITKYLMHFMVIGFCD